MARTLTEVAEGTDVVVKCKSLSEHHFSPPLVLGMDSTVADDTDCLVNSFKRCGRSGAGR